MNNYKIPIQPKMLMGAQKLSKMSEEESVRQHIYLILSTREGEYSFDRNYGSSVWNDDFDLSVQDNQWTGEMVRQLTQSIRDSEPRITDQFKVDVQIIKEGNGREDQLRQQFLICVKDMRLLSTNEQIKDVEHSIIFCPITIE